MLSLRSTDFVVDLIENARLAELDDFDVLEKLAVKSVSEMVEKRGGETLDLLNPHRENLREMFSTYFESENSKIVVGTIDEVVVGFGIVEIHKLQDGTPHASVRSLYVEEEARSVGVGESIMNALLKCATERKAVAIDAVALPGDRQTKNFFETHGLVARAITVQRSLT